MRWFFYMISTNKGTFYVRVMESADHWARRAASTGFDRAGLLVRDITLLLADPGQGDRSLTIRHKRGGAPDDYDMTAGATFWHATGRGEEYEQRNTQS